jgi:thiol-disulfide isomerase/thioredoxin
MIRGLVYASIALAAMLAGFITYRWTSPPPAVVLPEPTLVDLKGGSHALADWQGKVLVLNFWATWCPPCREEMPEFDALQKELGDKGLQFVGVAIDDPSVVRDFLAKHPVSYPVLVGNASVPDWADSLGNELSALPFSVVFDREGHKVYAHTGVFRRQELLEKVNPLLLAH